jgi:transcriptional regulator with XRE-family HTH domain
MKSPEIRGLLLVKGYRVKDIASHLAVTSGAISKIIKRQSRSRRIMLYIAQLLQMPPEKIFPESAQLFNNTSKIQTNTKISQNKLPLSSRETIPSNQAR